MKKWMAAIVLATSLTGAGDVQAAPQQPISVVVDGKPVAFPDAQPYIDGQSGRTMVPVRFISEALGAKVTWDGEKKTVTFDAPFRRVKKKGVLSPLTFSLKIGERKVDVSKWTYQLDAPAIIKESRTYVPLRFVSEALGVQVDWEQSSRTVKITKPRIISSIVDQRSRPHPETQPAVDEFVNNIKVEGNLVTVKVPKVPKGYVFTLMYTDLSDGEGGKREFDLYDLQEKYKPGDTIKIQLVGKGGSLHYAIGQGSRVFNGCHVYLPAKDVQWVAEK